MTTKGHRPTQYATALAPHLEGQIKPRHLTTAAFALRCGYHQESVRRMIREGRMPAVRFGKRDWRIPIAYVEQVEAGGVA